jgi:hypothetical protein
MVSIFPFFLLVYSKKNPKSHRNDGKMKGRRNGRNKGMGKRSNRYH